MKLQDVFSFDDFKICLDKIKSIEYFDISVIHKPYKFRFEFRYCANGIWKDNLLLCVGASYKDGGFSHPMQLNELTKDYNQFCKYINDYWLKQEKWYGDNIKTENVLEQISMFE